MRDLNKILLCGIVADAPRVKEFDDGGRLVTLGVKTATLESDRDGGERERPAWHRVTVRGDRLTEIAANLAPDSPVHVEGKLRTRKYRDREGNDVYSTEVVADLLRERETAAPHHNRSIILGNLARTPELREFRNDFAVMNLRVATSEGWNRRDGSKAEETEWHQIAVFGDLAKRLDGQLEKGQRVFVEGLVKTRKYTDREGRERRMTETEARSVVSSGNLVRGGGGGFAPRSDGDPKTRKASGEQDAWDKNVEDSGASGLEQDDEKDAVPF